jgi:MGT family glycosyltransferase
MRRGHQVSVFGLPDLERRVKAAGLGFVPVGEKRFPPGSVARALAKLGEKRGLAAVRYTIEQLCAWAEVMLEEGPELIRGHQVNALVANQGATESGSIADLCGIPFVTVCSAVLLNQEAGIPPFFTPWSFRPGRVWRWRNRLAYGLQNWIADPIIRLVLEFREAHGLEPYQKVNDVFSALAQISQFPKDFEFPREDLPPWFHFTGPFHSAASRPRTDFPWEKLGSRPLVYASMGTLQNRLGWVFEAILAACRELEVDLVLSTGGAKHILPSYPHTHLVDYVPQLELLGRASLMVTHGGTNSVMECLAAGVPMVAIPITNDHPGCAARLERSGAGKVVPLSRLSALSLGEAIQQVLRQASYRENAIRMRGLIQESGGVERAADIIERAVATRRPVLNEGFPRREISGP